MNILDIIQSIVCWFFFNAFDFCQKESPAPSPPLIEFVNPDNDGVGRFQSVCRCKTVRFNRPDSVDNQVELNGFVSEPGSEFIVNPQGKRKFRILSGKTSRLNFFCLRQSEVCPNNIPAVDIDFATFQGSIKAALPCDKSETISFGFNFIGDSPDCDCINQKRGAQDGPPLRRFLAGTMNIGEKHGNDYSGLAESLGGDIHGKFHVYPNLLSERERDNLVKYADEMFLRLDPNEVGALQSDHIFDIGVSELAGMVSPNSVRKIRDAVQDFGFVASYVQVRRTVVSDDIMMDLHSDGEKLSFLNIRLKHANDSGVDYTSDDSDFVYVSEQGLENPTWALGDAVAHGPNLIHGYSTKHGVRYILILFGSKVEQYQSWLEPADIVDLAAEEQATW